MRDPLINNDSTLSPSTQMSQVTWILESIVFPETHQPLRDAIQHRGHTLIDWRDDWWSEGFPAHISNDPIIFHGSLGNAAAIAERLDWSPGSYCPTEAFCCSSWYPSAQQWLVHQTWHLAPANELVANAVAIGERLGSPASVFVRPDSPLKPFSGRVVDVASLSLAALGCGFYYDDESLPVIAAPLRHIGAEWRFIIVGHSVVAGSAYDPSTRAPIPANLDSDATKFAAHIAANIAAPADVYVLDVCECDGDLRLLELNPFGGADLYAADAMAIVDAVSDAALLQ